jgi:23S rRNA pseudouridine1911/1915/1917 synthase
MLKSKRIRFEPQDIPLDIVYEDDDILVINKPRDLVVHPGAGNPDGTVLNALLHYYPPIADVRARASCTVWIKTPPV